ncbi:MAG: hypothetical protein DHS80DRAFT_22901 [Piptocephalis tieghemiana]|nr:MAG: hypothetical protein DHS80DRAFT_22901 [Piptocephalis tieghemiana]
MTRLEELPVDVLHCLHGHLSPRDALALSQTCHGLQKTLTATAAWRYRTLPFTDSPFWFKKGHFPPPYLAFPQCPKGLHGEEAWLNRLVYHEAVEAAWLRDAQGPVRNPLPRPLQQQRLLKLGPAIRPGLCYTEKGLVVAYNRDLYVLPATGITFREDGRRQRVIPESRASSLSPPEDPTILSQADISALSMDPERGDIYLGDGHGRVARWFVTPMLEGTGKGQERWRRRGGLGAASLPIQSVSATSKGCWSTSLNQQLQLWDEDGRIKATTHLGSRPWSSLALAGKPGSVIVGKDGRGSQNLTLYTSTPSGVTRIRDLGRNRSAIYGLSQPRPPSWLHSGDGGGHLSLDDVFSSASFDGSACLWDLRRPEAMILSLKSILNDDPLYSVCWDGWRVGAGGARHGRVDLWDVRFPSQPMDSSSSRSLGFSFAGREESPVYALQMDGARMVVALEHSVQIMHLPGVPGAEEVMGSEAALDKERELGEQPPSRPKGRRRRRRNRGRGRG